MDGCAVGPALRNFVSALAMYTRSMRFVLCLPSLLLASGARCRALLLTMWARYQLTVRRRGTEGPGSDETRPWLCLQASAARQRRGGGARVLAGQLPLCASRHAQRRHVVVRGQPCDVECWARRRSYCQRGRGDAVAIRFVVVRRTAGGLRVFCVAAAASCPSAPSRVCVGRACPEAGVILREPFVLACCPECWSPSLGGPYRAQCACGPRLDPAQASQA